MAFPQLRSVGLAGSVVIAPAAPPVVFVAAYAAGSNALVGYAMKKNVAGQKIGAQMVTATDGSAFAGSVTAYVTGDAGTQAIGSVGSGACTHEGGGYHTYAPAQAETNYDLAAFTFTGTGAIPATVQVYTQPVVADVNVLTVTSGAITATAYAADAITAATLAPDVTTELQAGLATSASITALDTKIGTPAGASVSADLAAIEAQTDDIGAAGAGLTAVPWNAAWDVQVESEVADALVAYDATTQADLNAAVAPLALATATTDIQARLPAALTAGGHMAADTLAISGDTTAADNLEAYLDGSEFMPVDPHAPDFSVSGATLTVKKPDGTTTNYTKTVTTDPSAEPIIAAT